MQSSKTDAGISNHIQDQEYTANKYVMRCFTVTLFVFALTFFLNLIGVFVIEQKLMVCAFVPFVVVYLLVLLVTRLVPLSNRKIKYFMLFSIAVSFTIIGIFITYHVILIPALLFLFATLYSSRVVMFYAYVLTTVSTIITVYGGYYFGLCDANMALLTTNRLLDYVVDGQFILTQVNTNPQLSLMLFFVIPRCLIYIAFMSICSSIFSIVKSNAEKALHATELEKFQVQLERKVEEQTYEIRTQQKKMEELFVQTITALSAAVDAKDRYTFGHSKRVAEYAAMLAERMGKTPVEQEEIYRAGLLHDIGKIRIPADIMNKPNRLTEDEYNTIKIHSSTGYHILQSISSDSQIAVAAKYHHERYDGQGYPNGLSGRNIPEIARIIGIADAYDAMTSNRSYRSALPQQVVRDEFERYKGTQFDPAIADIMLAMIDEDKDYTLKQAASVVQKVLVVDQNPTSGPTIAEIMSDEPMYEVISVGSKAETLAALKLHTFNLVLFDVRSIWLEDTELLTTIRKFFRGPIVLTTGDNTLDITPVLDKYDCRDSIIKPFSPILVKEIICNMTE